MTEDPTPTWVFAEQKRGNRGGIWLIVVLSLLAIAIVVTLLFFLVPRGDAVIAPSPSPTASQTGSSATPSTTPSEVPAESPEPTPPPVPDPDLETFADQVGPWLDDARRGLEIVRSQTGQDAVQVVDTLQQDAGRLSDTPAPSSIASDWNARVTAYADALGALRAAYENGSEPHLDETDAALDAVRELLPG